MIVIAPLPIRPIRCDTCTVVYLTDDKFVHHLLSSHYCPRARQLQKWANFGARFQNSENSPKSREKKDLGALKNPMF